jgi:hypothetical protein
VSFDLDVLAIDTAASDDAVRAMAKRCWSGQHPEGELDERIVGFYESLRGRYPDFRRTAMTRPGLRCRSTSVSIMSA